MGQRGRISDSVEFLYQAPYTGAALRSTGISDSGDWTILLDFRFEQARWSNLE